MKTRRLLSLLTLAAFLVSLPALTAAPILLGTLGSGGASSTLVELDPATGALLNTIGSVGYAVNGLTWDPTTSTLYGSTSVTDPNFNGLITINLLTGAGTPIGISGWGLIGTTAVTNITVNSSGSMYGWWDPSEDDLVSIDKSTGIATRVGESGLSTGANGLSFDNSGVLLMVNFDGNYYSIDTATGASTPLGNIGTIAHHGDFHPVSNLYYGIDRSSGNPRSIVVADLSNGTVTTTLPTEDNLHTLTFIPDAAVPEPGTWGLVMAGLGVVALKRRRR